MATLQEHIEDKYEILETIKEGWMGSIYKVRHRLLDEVRVVKVIRSQRKGGKRFLREAKVAIRLRHPHLDVLYDFSIDDSGNAFTVMEYIDGYTLQEVLAQFGLPSLALSLEMIHQVLSALSYLHRQKVVHRDISPDNVMLTRDVDGKPLVKLIDLGIAKPLDGAASSRLTTTGIFLGKPCYASPEQFGAGEVGPWSDQYSLGVLFYELLTGFCPIAGRDLISYMHAHLHAAPLEFAVADPKGLVPEALREIVLRTLAKKAEDRFEDVEALSRAIDPLRLEHPLTGRDLDKIFLPPLPQEFRLPSTNEPALRLASSPKPAAKLPKPEPLSSTQEWLRGSVIDTPVPLKREKKTVQPPRFRRTGKATLQEMERAADVLSPAFDATPPTLAWPTSPTLKRRSPLWGGVLALMALVSLAAVARPFLRQDTTWKPAPVRAAPRLAIAPSTRPTESPAEDAKDVPEKAAPVQSPPDAPAPQEPMREGALIRRLGAGVVPPEVLHMPDYAYPEAAVGSGLRAHVRVALLVDEKGNVIDAAVKDGGPAGKGFDEVALAAAKNVRYQPATRDGLAGKMWTEMYFEF